MAAAVVKSRPKPAEAHVEWWSPQQALTMILTGDEVAATAAAGQAFADFVEEMKRRGLAEWIDEALSELRAGVLLGAISDERIQREQCVPEDAPCMARGLPGSGTANAPQNLDATVLLRPGDFSASKPMPINGEVVFGAPNHVEWRALEFERSGVLRVARWARRDGWLERRVADIGELIGRNELSLLSSVQLVMLKMCEDDRRQAAIVDRDFPQAKLAPKRMQASRWSKLPPLWLMRQASETAAETWDAAHRAFDKARVILLEFLKSGKLRAYPQGESDKAIGFEVFCSNKIFIFNSSVGRYRDITIRRMDLLKLCSSIGSSRSAPTARSTHILVDTLAEYMRTVGIENVDYYSKEYWAGKIKLPYRSRLFNDHIFPGARSLVGLPRHAGSGPKPRKFRPIDAG